MPQQTIRTNIVLDKQLLEEAFRETGLKTRRELVDHALRELLRHKHQRKLLAFKGSVEWTGDLDAMREGRVL
ncbi:MAG: type II toxin-antitoxin system VapB family antitoxin [Rhodothermales bacterium]|nr:type II toxin-antitoxin system VapB family antitoxin [Rhodothermales bacterium]